MADRRESTKRPQASRTFDLPDAHVKVTSDERLKVEFRIDDLVNKLIPGGIGPVANCGGCHGCSGCSM